MRITEQEREQQIPHNNIKYTHNVCTVVSLLSPAKPASTQYQYDLIHSVRDFRLNNRSCTDGQQNTQNGYSKLAIKQIALKCKTLGTKNDAPKILL